MRPETSSSRSVRLARRSVAPWVVPPRSARLAPRRPVATRASSDESPSGEAPPERAPARSKSNSARAKGGGGVRAARGRPPNASSEWRAPATKAASTRAKAAERRGASLDSADEGETSSSGASAQVSETGARGRRRERSTRAKTPNKTTNSNANLDPFASLARGALTADVEKELGRAVQELLRVEAMQNRLCEETIAAELRNEPTEDVFSKAFGKKTTKAGSKQSTPRSIVRGVSRDSVTNKTHENKNDDGLGFADETVSPVFRRRLASTLGYPDVVALDAAVARGRAARRAFVTHNFGLAASVADDVWGKLSGADRGLLSRDDLTLYGCAGLARAADRFDPDRGYKFSTYCYFWVRKAVVDSVKDCGRTIRLPKYLSEVLRETRKAEASLEAKLGRPPSDAELAEATDVDVARVREWRQWAMSPLSLDGRGPGGAGADDGADALIEVVSVAGGSTNGGSGVVMQSTGIEDGGNPAAAAEADADADLLRVALDEALATLLPREQFVLRHRFGLASASARALACSSTGDGTPPGWLQASSADEAEAMVAAEGKEGASRPLLGSLLGVSAETVRTIERRGLAKLKQPSRAGAVLAHVDDETRTRMEQSDGGLFAAALADAAEKADRRAGGGRVFGAFAGGAVPASALGGKTSKRTGVYSEADAKRGRRAPRRGKKVPRPASAKKQGSTRGLPAEKERTSDGEKREGKREQKETEKEKEKEVIAIRSA